MCVKCEYVKCVDDRKHFMRRSCAVAAVYAALLKHDEKLDRHAIAIAIKQVIERYTSYTKQTYIALRRST